MTDPNRVTAYLKVTAEFYDPEATPETVRACVEQDLEDAGYEVEVSSFGNWIPVKDKPPGHHEHVFVYSLANGIMAAIYTTSGQWVGDDGYYVDDVTHWMPFPEKPEDEA